MTPSRTIGVLLFSLSLILSAIGGTPLSTAEDAAPLTNVDIVRRVLAGDSTETLISLIRGSTAVEFDVSDEMQEELTIAGVPAAVVRAMVEHQAALELERNPPPPEEETADAVEEEPGITILIHPDPPTATEPGALSLIDIMSPEMKEQLGLREEPARFTDIGLFLGCITADHVPDHWRSHTPLGRDFIAAPRHKLLAFVSGAVSEAAPELSQRLNLGDGAEPAALLRLDLPAQIDALLEPDVVHDLVLGIALQAEGRFYLVLTDGWGGLVPSGRVVTHARVLSGKDPLDFVLELAFDHSADEGVDPPTTD